MKKSFLILSVGAFFITIMLGLCIGSFVSITDSLKALLGGDEATRKIIFSIRMPRTILAMLVGGNLALAGAIMQGFFRNPMAEPYIVGVSSGAGLGAVIAVISGLASLSVFALPAFAFVFALGATTLVYLLSIKSGRSHPYKLLLSGIAASSLLGSITYLLLQISLENWQAGREIIYWMMGSLESKTIEHLMAILPFSVIAIVASFFFPRILNIMSMGETHSRALGVELEKTRVAMIAASAMLTGSAVSVAGMIGFVGLIVPHIVRLISGANHHKLLPLSFIFGAIFLAIFDIAIRALSVFFTIKLGILTGLVGAPFFLYLLIREKRGLFV